MGMSLSKLWELVMDGEAWNTAIHGVAESPTRLSNWTELNWTLRDSNLYPPPKANLIVGKNVDM